MNTQVYAKYSNLECLYLISVYYNRISYFDQTFCQRLNIPILPIIVLPNVDPSYELIN